MEENCYRGSNIGHMINIQCMNKDTRIKFDFMQETANIRSSYPYKEKKIHIESMAPKRMFKNLLGFC